MSVKSKHKVSCKASVTANYIYHMLSVSRINYDNWYGAAYRQLHNQEDLLILSSHSHMLTLDDEETTGRLYTLLITFPSCLTSINELRDYFEMLDHLFVYKDIRSTQDRYGDLFFEHISEEEISPADTIEECLYSYQDISAEIVSISQVMLHNIDTFMQYVWTIEEPILDNYAKRINKKVNKIDLMKRWDNALEKHYYYDHFDAIVSRAIDSRPHGINLSKTKDLFGVVDNHDTFIRQISHEIGVFSIISSDPMKYVSNFPKYQKPIESMASYFNNTVYPTKVGDLQGDKTYRSFMEACHKCGQPLDIEGWIEASIKAIEE